jgi:hypothetical protein
MYLWIVSRTDDADYEEVRSALVRAETEDAALHMVCGGPHPDFPGVKALDLYGLHGFKRDRSNATVQRLTEEGEPGILMDDTRSA